MLVFIISLFMWQPSLGCSQVFTYFYWQHYILFIILNSCHCAATARRPSSTSFATFRPWLSSSPSLSCCHALYVLLLSSQHIKLLSGSERERERVSEGGGSDKRGRVRQTSTTFAGKSFRIFKRKSLYKSKTDYKCCAISSRNSVGSGRRGRGRWEEMCVGGWGKKIEKGLCVRSQQLRNSWAQLLSSARFSSSLAAKCQLITPPFFLFFHFSSSPSPLVVGKAKVKAGSNVRLISVANVSCHNFS